jgi:hypothetical protein
VLVAREEGVHQNVRQEASTGIGRLCASVRSVVKAPPTTEKMWKLLSWEGHFCGSGTVSNFDDSIGAELTKVLYFGNQINHYFSMTYSTSQH